MRELRQNLSVYLRRVRRGESHEVTEHGRPVVVLQPVVAVDDPIAQRWQRAGSGFVAAAAISPTSLRRAGYARTVPLWTRFETSARSGSDRRRLVGAGQARRRGGRERVAARPAGHRCRSTRQRDRRGRGRGRGRACCATRRARTDRQGRQVVAQVTVIEVSDTIRARAALLAPATLRCLDALHLAPLSSWGTHLTLWSPTTRGWPPRRHRGAWSSFRRRS